MNNLTEQWKKGELPDGKYYCKTGNGVEILRTWRGLNNYVNLENMYNEVFIRSMDDCEVLAPVPSYEEYQANQKWLKSLEEKIKIYERKDKQATETSIAYEKLLEENAKLNEQINHLSKTQARQFRDNQNLQVKAEHAKDVVNIDTARQIKQLKELLKECRRYIDIWGYEDTHGRAILPQIDEVLK